MFFGGVNNPDLGLRFTMTSDEVAERLRLLADRLEKQHGEQVKQALVEQEKRKALREKIVAEGGTDPVPDFEGYFPALGTLIPEHAPWNVLRFLAEHLDPDSRFTLSLNDILFLALGRVNPV